MGFRVVPSIGPSANLAYSWSINGLGHLTSQSLQSKIPAPGEFQGAGPVRLQINFESIEDLMQFFEQITGSRVQKKGLMLFFCLVLLSLFAQRAALAQQPASRFEATGLDKPAQDITLAGTVAQLDSTRTPGAPRGILLTVNGPEGAFTAILGVNLSPQLQHILAAGSTVQVTGMMETIGGAHYLLARTITAGGKQTTLRNEHGFAVYSQARTSVSKTNLSGGAR
jgi:hypothetical protein